MLAARPACNTVCSAMLLACHVLSAAAAGVHSEDTSMSTYHVSAASGSDANPGTLTSPFGTLHRCLSSVFDAAPDSDAECVAHDGTYRESVDLSQLQQLGAPSLGVRRLRGAPGAQVVLSGLDTVPGLRWVRRQRSANEYDKGSCVWQAEIVGPATEIVNGSTTQLFYRGKPMVHAQYPNLDITRSLATQALDPKAAWVRVGKGSRYGTIVDPGLRQFPSGSLNEVRATLNVAHQFFTWTREVKNFSSTNGSFNYPMDLGPGIAEWCCWSEYSNYS